MTQNSTLKEFRYDLVIMAEDSRQADRVMIERTGFDEDLREYGVGDYQISASPVGGREADPVDPEEDAAEQERLKPLVSNPGDVRGVTGWQFYSFARINTILGGGPLPEAHMVAADGDGPGPVLELVYHLDDNIRLRLDETGSLLSMEARSDDGWDALEGGALHALVVDAL